MKSTVSGCGQSVIIATSLPARTSFPVRGCVRAVLGRRNLDVREKRGAAVERSGEEDMLAPEGVPIATRVLACVVPRNSNDATAIDSDDWIMHGARAPVYDRRIGPCLTSIAGMKQVNV